jgi:succinate dehydrogenase/fumarate reductase flavoprotein subunit
MQTTTEGRISRRGFLTGAGAAGVAGAVAASGAFAAAAPAAQADEAATGDPIPGASNASIYDETPAPYAPDTTSSVGQKILVEHQYLPEVPAPETTAYECDVLVVGCGWAGLHAAVTAADAGASVVVVDKGRPGFSGLSPFSQGATYFLEDFDDREGCVAAMRKSSEYLSNLDYFDLWLDESAAAVEQNRSFGLMETYDTALNSGYWDAWDPRGYRMAYMDKMRQNKWVGILEDHGVRIADHTMFVDVTRAEDGRVTGGVGFHVKSCTPITFNAKAVVLCTGTGSMKSTGYPTSEDTFDGEYICYNLGLTTVGKEFDDFHQTASYAPGSYFYDNTWEYCENMSGSSIGATVDTVDEYTVKKLKSKITYRLNSVLEGLEPVDGSQWQSSFTAATTIITNEYGESDPRQTDYTRSKERVRDVFGAAPGMNSQLSCGVFCGWDDTEGYTGIPGLYVAGNGIYGSMINGAVFCVQTNHPCCCVMGNHSGQAAADYAAGIEATAQDEAQVSAIVDEIMAPSTRAKGLDPNLIVEELRTIMVDPGVHIVKSEKALTAALMKVELIRDNQLPLLMGLTGHDLRLCLEAKHKCLSAEMKLKANLFRTESRGMHYRSDYPFHDDENWLCHVGVYRDEEGNVACRKIEIPDEWKGDLSEEHTSRYLIPFPGELAALGIEQPAAE